MAKEIITEEEPKNISIKEDKIKDGKGKSEQHVLEEIIIRKTNGNIFSKILIVIAFPFIITFFLVTYSLIFLFYAIGIALFMMALVSLLEVIMHLFNTPIYSLFSLGILLLSIGCGCFLIMWMNWAFRQSKKMLNATQHFIKALWKGVILNEK